jgi:hypothetical protein
MTNTHATLDRFLSSPSDEEDFNEEVNTTMPATYSTELVPRLPPEQQWQLDQIWQGINLSIHLEEQRMKTALAVETQRSQNAFSLANQEHQNKLDQIHYQANRDDQREAMKAQSAATQAKQTHEHQLERMQVELQNSMALAEFKTGLSVITTLMEEDGKVRTSMLARMENSHEVRDDVFKMLAGAVIQEKLAQKQHKRDMEKMQLESSLKRAEQIFQGICLRLSKLLDGSKDEQVKQEIAELHAMWNKEENKDD